jgi:two-component system sensor histidine kinase DegS
MHSSGPFTAAVDETATGHLRARGDADVAALIELHERERVRIGFDVHDGPAQTMSAALLQVRMLQGLEGEELERGLAELRSMVAGALEEIYGIIEHLGGRDSDDSSLASRVRSCVDTFASRCDIETELEIEGDCGPVSPSLQIAVARIVQEALSNVSRHSDARHVRVRLLLSPEEVSCRISDDGHGFDLGALGTGRAGREPYGLHGMRERARLLDGECVVDSTPGHGAHVMMRIPVWRP